LTVTPSTLAPRHRLAIPLGLALFFLTVVVFTPVYGRDCRFITIDDDEYVVDNPHVNTGVSAANARWAFTAFHSNNWHPLTWLSLQLDAQMHGLDPQVFHLSNVLLHAASAVALLAALWRMTGALWRSALVAALFAWHPLHVESVAWVAERKDVLSGLFWMLCLWAYACYAERPSLLGYAGVLLLYALGLAAKPMLVTLPCVLLLLDYWPLGRWRPGKHLPSLQQRSLQRLVVEKLPFFLLAGASSALTVSAQAGVMKSMKTWPLWVRLGNAAEAYVRYLAKWLWPRDLSIFYPHPGRGISIVAIVGCCAVLVIITALVLWQGRRRPYLPVGWFWYVGTLVPVIGIVQVGLQAMADRYAYLPSIGLSLMLVWGAGDRVLAFRVPRPAAAFAAAVLLLACLLTTCVQAGYWRDGVTVLEHAEAVSSPSATIEHCLGEALVKAQKDDAAAAHFQKALRLDANDMFAHQDLGTLFGRQAMAFGDQGNFPAMLRALDESLAHLSKAAELNPSSPEAHNFLGETLAVHHVSLRDHDPQRAEQELRLAIEQLRIAIGLEPRYTAARVNLGKVFLTQGNVEQAIEEFKTALRIDPHSADAREFLAVAQKILRHKGGGR
jgi:tetratricopeptide (TPR) repeat protein